MSKIPSSKNETITVPVEALRAVVSAFYGPQYSILALQALRHKAGSPVFVLHEALAEHHEQMKRRKARPTIDEAFMSFDKHDIMIMRSLASAAHSDWLCCIAAYNRQTQKHVTLLAGLIPDFSNDVPNDGACVQIFAQIIDPEDGIYAIPGAIQVRKN